VSLRPIIEQEIREHGPIPFSRYMDLCLYHPEFGFYCRNVEQFGKAGDFYTSSDVYAVFGRLLARQFEEMWRVLGSPPQIEVLELGPGRGLFARDVLAWSEKKLPRFFQALHYSLAERSPALRERLKEALRNLLEGNRVSLLPEDSRLNSHIGATSPSSQLPATKRLKNSAQGASPGSDADSGRAPKGRKIHDTELQLERALVPDVPIIIFANEFFDALPVEVLSRQGALRISVNDRRLLETWVPPSMQELEFLDRHSVHPEAGERIEVPLQAQGCMSNLTASIRRGFILAIDYGYTREEQLAGRHRGTLMAYRQHSASPNPYEAPGEQDLTAHVNFTALAVAAAENGMQVQPLLTQSQFLMGIGEKNQFADAFEDCCLPQEHAKVALQLKHLVTPAGVGESFHVLVAGKGIEEKRMADLSGLSFTGSRLQGDMR
jgi:SAM-dependent MidA family methyltransferase